MFLWLNSDLAEVTDNGDMVSMPEPDYLFLISSRAFVYREVSHFTFPAVSFSAASPG